MAGDEGFEPPNAWTKTRCLTTWRIPIVELCSICFFECAYTQLLIFSYFFECSLTQLLIFQLPTSSLKIGSEVSSQDRPDKPGSVHSHLTVADVAAIYLSVRLPPSPAAAV